MVYVLTMGYCRTEMAEKSFAQYYATKSEHMESKHYFLNQHYPLDEENNTKKLADLCAKYGIAWLDSGKNLGLHDGFNYMCQQIPLQAGDVLIAFDADNWPLGRGWDLALVTAIRSSADVAWASLMNSHSKRELKERGYDQRLVNGHLDIWVTHRPVVNSICAFDWNWLNSVGGLQEPLKFYGLLEMAMWEKLKEKNKRWAFLTQWEEGAELAGMHDKEYTEWKWVHAHLKKFDGDFGAWLKAGKPGLE